MSNVTALPKDLGPVYTMNQRRAALHIQNLLMQAHAIAKMEGLVIEDEISDMIGECRRVMGI